eukprot:scaffold119983_cov42-Tisochrysis_lutea.AAC.1
MTRPGRGRGPCAIAPRPYGSSLPSGRTFWPQPEGPNHDGDHERSNVYSSLPEALQISPQHALILREGGRQRIRVLPNLLRGSP